jgi:SAM-dependent methyltransferase
MTIEPNLIRRHFESGGDAYAKYRPTYPPALAEFLAGLAPDRKLVVDVGCGTGQLSVLLAEHFDRVEAFDISADQVANATPHPKVSYSVASCDDLPVDDGAASLITVAQAAHWFDLPPFYEEVRRIASPGAALALIAYTVPVIEGPFAARFYDFYDRDLGRYWPAERDYIRSEYRDLPFPFEELAAPKMQIERDTDLASLIGHMRTWSATRRALADGQAPMVDAFVDDAYQLWGDPSATLRVIWPVRMRVGRL